MLVCLDGVKGWALWGGPVLRTDDAVSVGDGGVCTTASPPQWGLTVTSERERGCSGKTCSNAVEMSLVRQGDESLMVRSLATTLGSHALHARVLTIRAASGSGNTAEVGTQKSALEGNASEH